MRVRQPTFIRSKRAERDQTETLAPSASTSSSSGLEERALGGRLEMRQGQWNGVALDLVGLDESTLRDDGEVLDTLRL